MRTTPISCVRPPSSSCRPEPSGQAGRHAREHPEAVTSIYEDLYGEGAAGDSSEHSDRDVAISLFAEFDAEG